MVATSSGQRPLLFLDVDGPLIPFGAPPEQYPTYRFDLSSPPAGSNPLLARINPENGPRPAALPCDLVWATTWMSDANECVSPRLGLPDLAVVDWPESSDLDEQDERDGLHRKTRALADWAAGRPFVRVDDEITDADRVWVRAHHRAPALLHRVDPRQGLADTDYTVLTEWLRKTWNTPPHGGLELPVEPSAGHSRLRDTRRVPGSPIQLISVGHVSDVRSCVRARRRNRGRWSSSSTSTTGSGKPLNAAGSAKSTACPLRHDDDARIRLRPAPDETIIGEGDSCPPRAPPRWTVLPGRERTAGPHRRPAAPDSLLIGSSWCCGTSSPVRARIAFSHCDLAVHPRAGGRSRSGI